MSGERGTAVSKKNASARKKHEKTSIRDRIFQFPRKMTGRLFLLLILCAVLSIFTFRYTMQHQTWVYVELVKRGITSFNPEKIVQETEIVQMAQQEAEKIISEAKDYCESMVNKANEQSDQIISDAEAYINSLLAHLEGNLDKVVEAVKYFRRLLL